jgi:hypothetical protein
MDESKRKKNFKSIVTTTNVAARLRAQAAITQQIKLDREEHSSIGRVS